MIRKKRKKMILIKNKLVVDFYIPYSFQSYERVLLLLGYKRTQVTDDIVSHTVMIFGLRIVYYS